MSIEYINYKSQRIMFADYTACKLEEQQLELLEKVAVEMAKDPEPTLLLLDYEGVSGGMTYMSRVKELGNTVFKKHMKSCSALGISGLKKILFNGYNRATGANNVRAFNTREEALEWLVK